MTNLLSDINSNLNLLVNDCSDKKRVQNYLEWIKEHSSIIIKEKDGLKVNQNQLPTTINTATFNYLYPYIQTIINTYYYYEPNKKLFIQSNKIITTNDCTMLYNSLILVKRNIVWINFGFNIGCEFGGTHPAVILKNLGDVLIVAPISSNTNGICSSNTVVCINENEVYNMPSRRKRFTNITRITPVSILRIDTSSKPGSLNVSKFNEINTKLKNFF